MRATISCLFLQLCQGSGSHPASPDPGMDPGLLPRLRAPAIHDAAALGAAVGCPWFLSRRCPSPWHCSLACPAVLPLLLPLEAQLAKSRSIWECQETGQFCRMPSLPSFLPSLSPTDPSGRLYLPLCFFSSSFGAILANVAARLRG